MQRIVTKLSADCSIKKSRLAIKGRSVENRPTPCLRRAALKSISVPGLRDNLLDLVAPPGPNSAALLLIVCEPERATPASSQVQQTDEMLFLLACKHGWCRRLTFNTGRGKTNVVAGHTVWM